MNMGFLDKIKKTFSKKKKIVRNKDEGTALARYRKSFFHAIDGIIYATICEHNMIIIIVCAIFAIILGFILHISFHSFLFIIGMIGAISASELINTSIEALVDLVTPNFHKLAKIAKDTASSATLILCITALIGGLLIFIPPIIELL